MRCFWVELRLGCSAMVPYFLFECWMLMCCLDCFRGRDSNRVEQRESVIEEERETLSGVISNFVTSFIINLIFYT